MKCLLAVLALVLVPLSLSAVEIVAHRGASFDAPENTLASIKLSWVQNADASEFDVYLSKDGRIVVMHDADLKRTGGVDRKVVEMTADELKAIDIGKWKGSAFAGEMVPTLEQMLKTVPPGRRVFIEVKCGPEIVPELDRVMKSSGLKNEQLTVIAFNSEVIAAIKKMRPEIQAYWLVSLAAKKDKPSPKVENLIATAKRIKSDALNISATPEVLNEAFATAVKEAGLKLLVWTVDDVDLARRMIALGVVGVTTNRPAFMRQRLAEDPATLRAMSFNIRYAAAKDGDNSWVKRKDLLVDTIKSFDPDLLGTQETLAVQRDDLAKKLTGYTVFAAGRDDGKDGGEMMAVFYRKSRFEKLDGGHFWLSESPDTPGSKSWDSALPRMVTWLKLKDRHTPQAKPVLYLNTHFDHRGPQARLESARLLRAKCESLGKDCRVIVGGDFNCGEGSEPYKALFDGGPVLDTFRHCHAEKGPCEGTFCNFKPEPSMGPRIDWIGCSADWCVCAADIDRTVRNGRTPSDHFAVTVTLAPERKSLRVLCYNIHHGEGTDGRVDLLRLAKVITDAKPDFVALQEVDSKTKRSGGVDLMAELARLTGLHARFGKAIDYDGGEYGQAVLSRFPIKSVKVHKLPGEPEREQRIAVEATVIVNGKEMLFASTHLHHNHAPTREGQAKTLNEIYAKESRPVILAGDLNAAPGDPPLEILGREWTDTASGKTLLTFPAATPAKQIDFVLVRPTGHFGVRSLRVLDEPAASDHRPLFVELEFKK